MFPTVKRWDSSESGLNPVSSTTLVVMAYEIEPIEPGYDDGMCGGFREERLREELFILQRFFDIRTMD